MRISRFFAIFVFFSAVITSGQTAPVPAPQQNPSAAPQSPPQQTPPSNTPLKSNTRLVTVDVVVTDSHGAPVRGLKKEDFQIIEEHNREQQTDHFEFVDRKANAAAHIFQPPASGHIYSNALPQQMTIPPTVLMMDALNTDIANQSVVHQHMVSLLRTLPANTSVAVFILGHTLRMVQNFSTDPGLLRAAVDKTLSSLPIDQNPQDDPDSMSNIELDQNGGTETSETQALEDFEAMEYEAQMAIRVDETTDAMVQIAKYLGGYTGRKNLIWFSESFPNWIEPSSDFGTNPFAGSASYSDKINAAAEALTDAQIAVYPVDAKGLAPDAIYTATQNPHINPQNPGAGFAAQLRRQNNALLAAQATMQDIAESTGGKPCMNTNDLSGCVQSALDDGSTYYELSYYPQGIEWDGRFHKITVKTTQHGLKMTYRRGYIATDTAALLKRETPDVLLKQACNDPLPSTSISLTAEAISPVQTASQLANQVAESRYLLTISPSALSFTPVGEAHQLNLRVAICEYNPKDSAFQYFPRDLSRSVPEGIYRSWQADGIRNIFDYAARPENKRLRFAVLDEPSGALGSLDVPAHPHEFGTIPGPVAPASPGGSPGAASTPVSATAPPAAAASAPAQQAVTVSLTFHGSAGQSSVLDWTDDSLSYRGDLAVVFGAPAFFQKLVGTQFHCQSGSLVPNDANSTATPKLIFQFRNPSGQSAIVDLTGSEAQYSGDLPVDTSAKPFFEYVRKISHCTQQ
jgi:VWFA-related protein